jgi:hypothetical protein
MTPVDSRLRNAKDTRKQPKSGLFQWFWIARLDLWGRLFPQSVAQLLQHLALGVG